MILDSYLRLWRRERLLALWSEGALRFGIALAACLLAALCLDAGWMLPHRLRWILFVVGAGGCAAGIHRHFLRPLGLLRPPELLRGVAMRYPALKAYLLPAWELWRWGVPENTSGDLAQEHQARTEVLLKALPREPVFGWRASPGQLRAAAAVLAAWGLSWSWLNRHSTAWARILAPWSDVRLESLVSIKPGNLRVAWGAPVAIEARWLVGQEASLALWLRSEGGVWQKVPWDSEGQGFLFRIAELTGPLAYQLQRKDLTSETYTLTPLPFPRLTNLTVSIRPPGQAEVPPEPLEGGAEVSGLRGSWIMLRGRPSQALKSAAVKLSTLNAPVNMKQLGSGELEAGFPLMENGAFQIDLVSADGIRDPDPVAYALKVMEDAPPSIELLSPAFELEVSPKEKLPITFEARDDYGLSSVSLFYRVGEGPEAELALKRFATPPKEFLGDFAWDLSRLSAGARVEFWLKATDNARPRPQTALSNKGVVHLVDFEAAHEKTQAQWLKTEESLSSLAEAEGRMQELLKGHRDFGPAEAGLQTRWSTAVEDSAKLASAMREDPYANPGMTKAAEEVSEMLAALKSAEWPKALQAERSGAWAEAERRHQELESKVRKASEFLKEGREIQAMQDFWAEAHHLDVASSEIDEALSRVTASGKPPSPEERKRIEEALADLQRKMEALSAAIEALPKPPPGSLREQSRKIYVVPLNSARRQADALRAALERGDYAAAAREARRLAEQLSRVQESIAQAAREQSEGFEDSAGRRMESALALWQEVVEGQSRSLQTAQGLEETGLKKLIREQEKLLRELAQEQASCLRDGAELGTAMPAEAMAWMRDALKEFSDSNVRDAPKLLDRIVSRLKDEAERKDSEKLRRLADREGSIRERLKAGAKAPAPDEEELAQRIGTRAMQRQVRGKTADLESSLRSLSEETPLPQGLVDPVRRAQVEQSAAEEALGEGEVPAAVGREQKALELLEQGLKELSQAVERQRSIEQGSTGAFAQPRGLVRPVGARGATGADTGFVPLPDSRQYQPPQEIRREVEKSLREKRPKQFEEAVDQYLRRMSQ